MNEPGPWPILIGLLIALLVGCGFLIADSFERRAQRKALIAECEVAGGVAVDYAANMQVIACIPKDSVILKK